MKTESLLGVAFLIVVTVVPFSLAGAAGNETNCTTTKEFITALEYLRSQTDMKIPDAQARDVATRVAAGCDGAAGRFIRTVNVLTKAGLGASDSLSTGIRFALKTDPETATFATVFKYAFLEDYLDLDLRSSIQMANSLSAEFDGDTLAVRDDFEKLLGFCVSEKDLGLPKPECGSFAARVAKYGSGWSGGVAQSFLDTFEFLRSSKGPGLPTGNALHVAEDLVKAGPASADNFIQAYKYAASDGGLKLSGRDAVAFARNMAFGPSDGTEVVEQFELKNAGKRRSLGSVGQ